MKNGKDIYQKYCELLYNKKISFETLEDYYYFKANYFRAFQFSNLISQKNKQKFEKKSSLAEEKALEIHKERHKDIPF